jgi:hypothetical protein
MTEVPTGEVSQCVYFSSQVMDQRHHSWPWESSIGWQKLQWHLMFLWDAKDMWMCLRLKLIFQDRIFLNLSGLYNIDNVQSPVWLQQQESRISVLQSTKVEKTLRRSHVRWRIEKKGRVFCLDVGSFFKVAEGMTSMIVLDHVETCFLSSSQ